MGYQLPPKRFIWPLPVAVVIGWAKDIVTSWLYGLTLPSWLPIALAGIFVGLLVNDIYNPRSWLRHNWRQWRKVFDVLTAHAGHHQSSPERIELICILKFRSDIKNALLTVRVVTPLPTREPDIKITHQERVTLAKDSEKKLRLGNIAITRPGDPFARHSVWGEQLGEEDLKPGQHSLICQSKVIVEISVNHQTYRIYANILDHTREENSRIYLLTEDECPSLS